MNKEDLPGLLVAAFGLSPEELTALKILRGSASDTTLARDA